MATSTITALSLVVAGNLTDAAILPVDDSAAITKKVTIAMLRTQLASGTQLFTGNLTATDNLYDIGASGATRFRDLFLSRNLTVGGTVAITGVATFTAVPVFSAGVGALNSGSITSGFGAIDIGADALTAGAITGTTGAFSQPITIASGLVLASQTTVVNGPSVAYYSTGAQLTFAGGTGGYLFQNQGQTATLLSITNAGAVTLSSTLAVTGVITTSGTLAINTGGGYQAILKASGGSAQLGLSSEEADAASRNWAFRTNDAANGDFSIRQSNARLGDAVSAGTIRFSIGATGAVTIPGAVTLSSTLAVTGNLTSSAITLLGSAIATGASAGDVVLANAKSVRGVIADGSSASSLISLNSGNILVLGGQTDSVNSGLLPRLAYYSAAALSAGAAANNGIVVTDATNNRFVYYSGGARYYLTGTSF